ncbi:hypothetical protein EXIGLDRAFT_145076 [Exidia glandulosa HHB12029]|uniref:Uncharacterized protein n=1 Tax=Exidia glandulosa HHB12029 TaxID=1314781 RepID=A0A165NCV9_EXIGL|nr:hypothetical protein EXIGLDRAFT_145076 [Exidia glandulosa HHB12029]
MWRSFQDRLWTAGLVGSLLRTLGQVSFRRKVIRSSKASYRSRWVKIAVPCRGPVPKQILRTGSCWRPGQRGRQQEQRVSQALCPVPTPSCAIKPLQAECTVADVGYILN